MPTGLNGKIFAVVVAYNADASFIHHYESYKAQVDGVFVVNNSTKSSTTDMLTLLAGQEKTFLHLIESPENNLGLAQNLGIRNALEAGADWILLLDQDSSASPQLVTTLLSAAEENATQNKIGIIAANLLDPDFPHEMQNYICSWYGIGFRRERLGEHNATISDALYVAASGSLINADMLRKEKLWMEESFIIDHIDTDFCLKLRQRNYTILVVRDAVMYHKVGQRKLHRFLGRTIITTNHPPLRRYYHFRNRVGIWKRYTVTTPAFFTFDMLRIGYEIFRIIALESDKKAKLAAAFLGFYHGIIGKDGAKPGINPQRQIHKPHP